MVRASKTLCHDPAKGGFSSGLFLARPNSHFTLYPFVYEPTEWEDALIT